MFVADTRSEHFPKSPDFVCSQRYSVDFNSRADDANIPLSTVEPEPTADAVTQNGQSRTNPTDQVLLRIYKCHQS